jgi:DNA adenine methylase
VKLISQYDRKESFFYCDPPYYETEGYYEGGGFGRDDHARLAEALVTMQGKFLLSYNDCPEIRDLYDRPGIYIEGISRLSNMAQRFDAGCQYPELLISNYDTSERARTMSQMNIFEMAECDPTQILQERILFNEEKCA